jgi:hypothetical protein
MDNFVLMLANQSVPRLDSFGISSGKARERILELMATVPGMTRETAFMTAVMEQGAIAMEKVGEQSGGAVGAAARLNVAMTNLKNGVGRGFLDVFANVQGSLASIVTKLTPTITRIAQGLGGIANAAFNVLKNMAMKFMDKLGIDYSNTASNAEGWGANIVMMLAKGIVGAMSYVMNALNKLGQAITRMLKPGSPPKLLPNLGAWGTKAAAVYMEGWGEADLDAFDTLSQKIGSYLDTIPNMAQEKLIPLKAAVNAALAGVIQGAGGVASGSIDMFDKVLASIRKLPPGFTTYAHSLMAAQQAQNRLTDAMAVLDDAANSVKRAEEGLARATAETARAQDQLNRVTQEYDALLSPLNKELREIEDKKQAIQDEKRLAELRKTAANKAASASDRALAKLEMEEIAKRQQIRAVEKEKDAAVDAEQEKVDAAMEAEKAEQAKVDAAKAAMDLAQTQVDAAQQALEAAKKQVTVQERLLGIQTEANSMVKQQKQLLEQMAQAAAAAASAAASAAAALGAGAEGDGLGLGLEIPPIDTTSLDGMLAELDEEFGKLTSPAETLVDTWASLFGSEKTGDILGTAMDLVGQKMADALIRGASKSLGGAFDRMLGSMGSTGESNAVDRWAEEKLAAPLNAFIANAGTAISTWADTQATALETWFGERVTHFTNVVTEIETGAANWKTTIDTWLADQATALGTWFTDRLTDFTTWLGNVWTTFSTKLGELWTLISTKFQEIKTEIETKWGQAQQFLEDIDLFQIGKDILGGLLDGLKNKWSGIASWLAEKAAWVEEKWRAITRTRSPSQVFAGIGEDLMAGLDAGLRQGFPAVERTTAEQAMALPMGMAANTAPSTPAAPAGPSSIHLVLNIPGLGQAVGEVTPATKMGEAWSGKLNLHASAKSV